MEYTRLCDLNRKERKRLNRIVRRQRKRGILRMNEWVSVKDRLPDEKQSEITHDFEYVLCATTFGDVRAYKFGTPTGWKEPHFWNGCGKMDEYVTHWMSMPEMPKEGRDME